MPVLQAAFHRKSLQQLKVNTKSQRYFASNCHRIAILYAHNQLFKVLVNNPRVVALQHAGVLPLHLHQHGESGAWVGVRGLQAVNGRARRNRLMRKIGLENISLGIIRRLAETTQCTPSVQGGVVRDPGMKK